MSIYRLKGASGAVINQAHTLGERTVIGSGEGCDLTVASESVAPRHAEILEQQDQLILKRIDPQAETLVNGESIDEVALASGDEIRMGNCRWVLQAPGLRPEKVLTADAVRARRSHVPWLLVTALLSAAALAWYRGWLPF